MHTTPSAVAVAVAVAQAHATAGTGVVGHCHQASGASNNALQPSVDAADAAGGQSPIWRFTRL
ncbi:hypothetical protein EYC55_15325 [Xanthomonas oryzae]|nr:hypothetical protein EYC55_15325 [Xanthomonas oryzae]